MRRLLATLAGLPLLAAAPAPSAEAPVKPVALPAALEAAVGIPELSGMAWSQALGRWLVVTDDTGEGRPHAPLVLALGEDGRLDPEPVPIAGVEKLNDPEAICAGPDGTFFLTTSHSPNRKGRTPEARRQLLWLRLERRALRVEGRLDLSALASLPRLAGADERATPDVEGLAWRDGALFVGLKAPLAGGEAVILRLAEPLTAMRTGKAAPGALTRWAKLPLCVERAGAKVCQGISDLLFLADGSLVVAANAPKGGAADGGGAIWWVGAPVGASAPRLLRRFEGLKPEGLALAPDGGLVAVFDSDRQRPVWLRLPAPKS